MTLYTLRNKTRDLSLQYNTKKYVVVFKRLVQVHKVQYSITTDCKINILNPLDKKDFSYISGNLMLSIPKYKYKSMLELQSQEYFYIKKYENTDILSLPNHKDIGLLVPYMFEDETDDEFIFRTIMIDPTTDA